MCAIVLCELNADDVTVIPGKSRIFFVQWSFKNSKKGHYNTRKNKNFQSKIDREKSLILDIWNNNNFQSKIDREKSLILDKWNVRLKGIVVNGDGIPLRGHLKFNCPFKWQFVKFFFSFFIHGISKCGLSVLNWQLCLRYMI